MGDEDMPEDRPAPAVTVDRKPGSQIGLALTVLALVLASNSIINESWLTDSQDTDGDDSVTVDYSLTEYRLRIVTEMMVIKNQKILAHYTMIVWT